MPPIPRLTKFELRDEQIRAQVDVMNRDYNVTGVSWNLVTISRILSPEWFAKVAPDT